MGVILEAPLNNMRDAAFNHPLATVSSKYNHYVISELLSNTYRQYSLRTRLHCNVSIPNYIITLRIQALSLVESHDLLEHRRTELRHTKPYPIAFPYLYRSCTRDICKISTFSNFQMFAWVDKK
jgi:hypothetical protein